jgi:hypothetical protein
LYLTKLSIGNLRGRGYHQRLACKGVLIDGLWA